jgi:hypothetical protein
MAKEHQPVGKPRNRSSRKSRFDGGSASSTFIAFGPHWQASRHSNASQCGSRQVFTPRKDRTAEEELVEPSQMTEPSGGLSVRRRMI